VSVAPDVRLPITAAAMLATVMCSLDTTVVNVALPHMQGNLSASPEQITWVLTSYIIATAVMMPVSGWLAARIGLKSMLVFTIGGFTLASMLCGIAANLPQMVIFRLIQGVTAAPIQPLAQVVMLNINPPARHGRAMALFTMGAVVAPVVGPVVGGYLTEDFSWRWCFYINLPAGIGAMALLWLFLPSEEVQKRRFDFLGFGSVALGVAALQLMLDRGPIQDWFHSSEIRIEAIVVAVSLWVFAAHTLTAEHPLFPRRLWADPSFVVSNLMAVVVSVLLFSSLTLLPLMMQGLLGYPVLLSGLLSAPRGVVMLAVLQVMGRVDSLVDRRLLLAGGMLLCVGAFWRMSQFDLAMTGRDIIDATALQGVGQGIMMVPLSMLSFSTIPASRRSGASAVMNLLRNLGGSVGISIVQAMTAANGQTVHAALAAHARPDDPVVRAALPPNLSPETVQGALALNAEITRQASMVAYLDDFRLMMLLGLLAVPAILFLRQPRADPVAAAPETPPAH
jgi:DHA2 family multidrug resistance protein